MDPYQALGVSKGCTRDELKEAFRAKAQLVHPDRGGEPAAFIRLRHAFDQISDELERRPPDPVAETRQRPDRSGPDRRPKGPDPNWEPDLVVLDEPLPRMRPARPRDPNWEPELIVVDEEPRSGRFPPSHDPRPAGQNYSGWLRRFLDHSQPEEHTSYTSKWNLSGAMALLIAIFLTTWICWAAWSYAPATDTSEIAPMNDPTREP